MKVLMEVVVVVVVDRCTNWLWQDIHNKHAQWW